MRKKVTLSGLIDLFAAAPAALRITTKKRALRGALDYVDELGVVEGWLLEQEAPDAPVTGELWVNGKSLCRFKAARWREDLHKKGIGSGYHGFYINIGHLELPAVPFELQLRVEGAIIDGPCRRKDVAVRTRSGSSPGSAPLSVEKFIEHCSPRGNAGIAPAAGVDRYAARVGFWQFLADAYAYALEREPDEPGHTGHLEQLLHGEKGPSEVLDELCRCEEGQRINARRRPVPGDAQYPFY